MLIDISVSINENMAIYPGNPGLKIEQFLSKKKGDGANVQRICLGTHLGTHIDAPSHFFEDGETVNDISLEKMNGRAIVLDLGDIVDIEIQDLASFDIREDDIILIKTMNSCRYKGINVLSDYATLTYQAAEYLVKKKIKMVGIDYMTIERPRGKRIGGQSVHKILLGEKIVILEGIDLCKVTSGDYIMHCYPLLIDGADGSPVRAVLERR